MRGSPNRSIACDEMLRPYRHLAMRVLARAVLDVMDPSGSSTDRESALVFLSGSAMLQHWCRVAALNPDCIADNLEEFTARFSMVPPRIPTSRTLRQSDVV